MHFLSEGSNGPTQRGASTLNTAIVQTADMDLPRICRQRIRCLEPAANLEELPRLEFALLDNGRVLYYAGR